MLNSMCGRETCEPFLRASTKTKVIDLHNLMQFIFKIDFQVNQLSAAHIKYPTMYNGKLIYCIGLLNYRSFNHIKTLLLYIQFHQTPILLLLILYAVQLGLVQAVHIADIAQPRVQYA